MATLELRGVSLSRGQGPPILDAIDLSVAEGEFLVIVGPSGCGKTSLLRVVAGLETPTHGDVVIGGRVSTNLSPRERNLAMVFQNYALYPHLTVRDNLAFGLRARRTPADVIRAEVDRISALLGITSQLAKKPAALSGGERQRVALGRALVRHPALFLYDEPLSNLDARLREEMRSEIGRLHALEPTTSLYVTHDQAEAMTLGHRMAILSAGRIRQIGPPELLYREPADLFVAGFLGSPRMNLIEGNAPDGAFRAGSLSFALGARPAPRGEGVVLGVRPEDLRLSPAEGGAASRARVTAAEHMGREVLVHLEADGVLFRALVPPEGRPATGDAVRVDAAPARLHLFERGSGVRIPLDGEPAR